MKIRKDFIGMFDVAKGLLIILVLLLHHVSFLNLSYPGLIGPEGVLRINDLVPIGPFFVIAGYSFRQKKNLKSHIKNQARQLLLPYFAVLAVVVVCRALPALAAGELRVQTVSPYILGFLYGSIQTFEMPGMNWWVGGVVAMWFLPTLFFAGVFHQALHRIEKPWAREACIWGLTALAVTFPDAHRVQLPWFLVQSCAALGFLETGHLLKKHKLLYRKLNLPVVLLAAAAWMLTYRYSGVNMASNVWEHWMGDYLVGVLAASVVLQLYIKSGAAVAPGTQPLAYIGRNSMLFLCVHGTELLVAPWNEDLGTELKATMLPGWAVLMVSFGLRLLADAALCMLLCKGMALRRWKNERGGV